MTDNKSSNKRLAKNTLLMYFRMFIIMGISLITSRVVLSELGFEDFGIYNITNGIIISFSFVSTALISASQRYFAFTLGKDDIKTYHKLFNSCTTLFILLATTACLILDPVGIWLLENELVLPEGKLYATEILYHTVVLSFFLSFIRISFNSAVIAQEHFSFFAYLGIVEAVLKLAIVYCLVLSQDDKLILYGYLQLIVSLIISIIYVIYVHLKLHLRYKIILDKDISKSLLSFSGWSLYDALASIGKMEIVNLILNAFYGVLINAAYGVAKQVFSAINSFTSNFQVAYRPQITKVYASGDLRGLILLIFNTSKFSTVIFLIVAVPVCINIDIILDLWLEDVPQNASFFTAFFLVTAALETIGGPFWITAHAIGDIKWFQIITGTIRLLAIPLVYIYIITENPVQYVFVMLVISDLAVYIYRLLYLKKKLNFPVSIYVKEVTLKVVLLTFFPSVMGWVLKLIIEGNIIGMLVSTIVSISLIIVLAYYYLMDAVQRDMWKRIIKQKLGIMT